MRGIMNAAWLPGSVLATSAALVVPLAYATPPSPASGAQGWSKDEVAVLASLSLRRLPPVPVDPSNAVERLPGAIDLGRRLFSDARFSANGAVSCASCHGDSPKAHGKHATTGKDILPMAPVANAERFTAAQDAEM